MKKILYLFLYSVTIGMIISMILMPGHMEENHIPFFNSINICMIIIGTSWVAKSAFFMLLSPWYSFIWTRRKKRFAQWNYKPLVSVVIPAWNEEVGLLSTIKTIL